jgi:hypothetical protein
MRRVNVSFPALILTTLGCSGDPGAPTPLDPNAPPITTGQWYRPAPAATWQWQLQGAINEGYDVDVYDVDLINTEAAVIASLQRAGRKVICYFSAGSYESFRPVDVPEAARGKGLDGFEDEQWLDVRSPEVHRVAMERLDLAKAKLCDGVEPDNVDGYQNDTGFPLTETDQLAFNRFLANAAHERGLAVALKNDLDQIAELVSYFDFQVNEQCHEFDECDRLGPFPMAGKAAFVAEYQQRFVDDSTARDDLCMASRNANLRTLVLPLDLDDSFRFTCDP